MTRLCFPFFSFLFFSFLLFSFFHCLSKKRKNPLLVLSFFLLPKQQHIMPKGASKDKGGKKAPRKCNPYICFVKEQRPGIVKAQPSLQPKEVMKKIGEMWRMLTEDEKAKYHNQAKEVDKKNGIQE